VDALREFLGTLAEFDGRTPSVIIAVDELDKIDAADLAQRFINEIKGIFGAPGTQFLVAVSEDALAAFERRGLQVARLRKPFKWLVHCMSGGLPRGPRDRAGRLGLGREGQLAGLADEPAGRVDDRGVGVEPGAVDGLAVDLDAQPAGGRAGAEQCGELNGRGPAEAA
jgi:hypothetical protein